MATNVAALSGLRELWAETLGDPRICIAVLDGPVDLSHPSLSGAQLSRLETLAAEPTGGGSASRHGTHVASVIFGQHNGPIKGIAPRCRGLIAPIFQDGADGSVRPCSQLDLARAIGQAIEQGAQVINISGGQFSPLASAHPRLADAVRSCSQKGVLLVAAAGNDGCECLHVPGALPSVLAVGAMNSRGEPLDFSNWGPAYRTSGILAPGENILGAAPGREAVANSGTSYATPIVSGVAGLLLSLQLKQGLHPNVNAVRAALLQSALGCGHQEGPDCHRLLAGRLNISGAMSFLTKGVPNMAERTLTPETVQAPASGASSSQQPSSEPSYHREVQAAGNKPAGRVTPTEVGPNMPEEEYSSAVEEEADSTMAPLVPGPAARQPSAVSNTALSRARKAAVVPAACACEGGNGEPAQFVFALGMLGIDFGTEVRRDFFFSTYGDEYRYILDPRGEGIFDLLSRSSVRDLPRPDAPNVSIAELLRPNQYLSEKIIWTLNHDATPIYAIQPKSPFAHVAYDYLLGMLGDQVTEIRTARGKRAEAPLCASIAGTLGARVTLLTGQVVPVIHPDLRGMFNFRIQDLIDRLTEGLSEAERTDIHERILRAFTRFYYDFRNLGVIPQDRALNFTFTIGTNMLRAFGQVRSEEVRDKAKRFELDEIQVARSPICRPDSDCWDVKLTFFDLAQPWQSVRFVVRFAVDVSDVMPVAIGDLRSWYVR